MIYMKKVLKSINKFNIIILGCFVILFSLSSCKPSEPIEHIDFSQFPESFNGFLIDKDIYITSIGQAIDIEDFLIDVQYLNLFSYHHHNLLKASEVPDEGVVLIVIGCSIKGLSDAGITVEEETSRIKSFIKDAKAGRISVINWHIGGMARRGSTSDSLIEVAFSGANLNIFVKNGDTDHFLSRIASTNQIPSYEINYLGEIGDTLKLLALQSDGD